MKQDKGIKKYMTYIMTMASLGMVGLTFGIPGFAVGIILGFFLGRKLTNNTAYALRVAKRRKITDKFWAYAGVGAAGFIYGGAYGLIGGLLITLIYFHIKDIIKYIKKKV